jgi:hypothetical protein
LVGGPPGVALHTVVEGLPSGGIGGMFPVEVMTIGVGMVPNGAAGVIIAVDAGLATVDDVGTGIAVMEGVGGFCIMFGSGAGMNTTDLVGTTVTVLPLAEVEELAEAVDAGGAATIADIVPVAPTIDDSTAGVPGVICPVGVEQVTTVPGIVGSVASGTGANVVSGAPGWVIAENGLGPLSGEVTIAPGVDESPIAVVPMVETCARLALDTNSRATARNNKHRMVITLLRAI